MPPSPSALGRELAVALIAFVAALCLLAAAEAAAQGGGNGGGGPSAGQGNGGTPSKPGGGSKPGTPGKPGGGGGDSPAAPESSGDDGPALGSVNPLAIANPLCEEALKPREKSNCKLTGTPEVRYPTSNYGLESHIDDSGSLGDTVEGNFQQMLVGIANAIWLALLFVLNLILTLLGWAFTLNPFSDGGTMGEINEGLERFYRVFTSPWLVCAFVALGAWGVYKGIVKREVAASIGGMLVSVALMVGALVILHEPRASVGTASDFTNKAAQGVIGAPLEGSLKDPTGSYAAATTDAWEAMTMPGFAALNFSDVGWALAKPESEIVEIADRYACLDYAYLGVELGSYADFADECTDEQAAAVPEPTNNAEIWLRNSTGSNVRQKLWEEVSDETPWSGYLSIQGGGGAWTRLPLVILIAVGLLGGILLLAWLAIRLFMQAAVAFVLLLATPLALFMPAFGERGRAGFVFWAMTLAGAILSKLVYAALLAVVLFATNTIANLAGGSGGIGSMMAFLVMSGLWWSVYLKREELLGFVSVSSSEGGSGGGVKGAYYGSRMLGRALSPVAGLAGAGLGAAGGWMLGKKAGEAAGGGDDRDAPRSERDLDDRAEQRLDGEYEAHRAASGEQASREARLGELDQRHVELAERLAHLGSACDGSGAVGREAGDGFSDDAPEGAPSRETLAQELSGVEQERSALREQVHAGAAGAAASSAFVGAADGRQAGAGGRWGGRQLGRAREQLRREVDQPLASGAHAWRVGMDPERYQSLEGVERHLAHDRVRAQLRADKQAIGTIADRPAGLVGKAKARAARTGPARVAAAPAKAAQAAQGVKERSERRQGARSAGREGSISANGGEPARAAGAASATDAAGAPASRSFDRANRRVSHRDRRRRGLGR